MGIFRRQPPGFRPYDFRGGKRPPRRLPRWLLWWLLGVGVGVGSLIYIQENVLPPRLTSAESNRLTAELEQTRGTLEETQGALAAAREQVTTQQQSQQQLQTDLADAQVGLAPLKADIERFLAVLPPDPRGGPIGVRAGRFSNQDGALAYHVVLTQDDARGVPFQGRLVLAVEGNYANGREGSVTLDPQTVRLNHYQHLEGSLRLPAGLAARQVTVRVLDGQGRQQAMRIINVRG